MRKQDKWDRAYWGAEEKTIASHSPFVTLQKEKTV
jgi:hypothetical protein